MKRSPYEFRIDYQGRGYFGAPPVGADRRLPRNPLDDPWMVGATALERAKDSDFSMIPWLLDLYGHSGSSDVDSMCTALLSVAGPASCFPKIVDTVVNEPGVDHVLGLCGAMAVRGELSYVPILLTKYLSNAEKADAPALLEYIVHLTGKLPPSTDTEDFETAVLDRYHQLVALLGSERELVLQGERYGVIRLARLILANHQPPFFQVDWRLEFEAATGIECSDWFRDGEVRPLAVAAAVETFLEDPSSTKYEDGARYFFGHRIPHTLT